MAAEVGEKAPDLTLPADEWEGIVRAKQVESSPKDQPEVEAVIEDPDKAL